jgi:hypothetical protein
MLGDRRVLGLLGQFLRVEFLMSEVWQTMKREMVYSARSTRVSGVPDSSARSAHSIPWLKNTSLSRRAPRPQVAYTASLSAGL